MCKDWCHKCFKIRRLQKSSVEIKFKFEWWPQSANISAPHGCRYLFPGKFYQHDLSRVKKVINVHGFGKSNKIKLCTFKHFFDKKVDM